MRARTRRRLALALAWLGFAPIVSGAAGPEGFLPMPTTDLFRPLLADPKEPRFTMSLLKVKSDLRETTIAAVGFGENFGILRRYGEAVDTGWQLSLAGAVFAQFDINAPSSDLVNADYLIGLPLSWREGAWSTRVRVYHQSSHLGDEFLMRVHPDRINLSFESLELLAAYDLGSWRFYGGGEYLLRREPADLQRGMLHAGAEYRGAAPVWHIGELGVAHLVGGLDVKSWEQHDWSAGRSFKAGLEFRPARAAGGTARYWNLLFEAYDGPSPYGQFYTYDVAYWGLSIGLHL